MQNSENPTLKAIVEHKIYLSIVTIQTEYGSKNQFSFTQCLATQDIENEVCDLKTKAVYQVLDIPTKLIKENFDVCGEFYALALVLPLNLFYFRYGLNV